MKNSTDILRYAMDMEKRAKEFYTFYKDQVKNRSIKELFEGLAAMEDEHYDILAKQLQSLEKDNTFQEFDLPVNEGANLIEKVEKAVENMDLEYDLSDLPVLRMAFNMENDFALFYENALTRATDENAKKLLSTLAKWEREHRDAFQREVEMAKEKSWFGQGFAPF